jgi:hypothetical protein
MVGKVERESVIEKYLVDQVVRAGGEARKVSWVGRSAAPDRLVILNGRLCFVEVKRPGERPTAAQQREAARLGAAFATWVDSREGVDALVGKLLSGESINGAG